LPGCENLTNHISDQVLIFSPATEDYRKVSFFANNINIYNYNTTPYSYHCEPVSSTSHPQTLKCFTKEIQLQWWGMRRRGNS